MNNEQQEIIDEVYENYESRQINMYIPIWSQEEFINKCKTDTEFSEKWGLKIEERELSLEERFNIRYPGGKFSVFQENYPNTHKRNDPNGLLDAFDIPTKLNTIIYNDTKLESYE
jgi:hypothetical protein